ncbi:hypothetical protein T07_3057 [Trichinella nelsoni]|uniref:Uncharacterized protein n=1 Tax=Trichinella nelsoni TaxID=6336 RepID=A0A0V0RYU5_9BILA|nr:hypothetical protein T07_3057 [Trichinella nelsoni]
MSKMCMHFIALPHFERTSVKLICHGSQSVGNFQLCGRNPLQSRTNSINTYTFGCHTTFDHLDSDISYHGGRMHCDSSPLRLFGQCALSRELKRKGCMATALGMVVAGKKSGMRHVLSIDLKDLHEEIILRVPSSRILGVHDQLEQYPCLLC